MEIPDFLTRKFTQAHLSVASERKIEGLEVKEICLTNGARIILKCTKDGERQITLTAFAKGGASVLPPEKYSQLEGVAGYMEMGGIEKMDYDEILRATHTMKGIASNLEFTQLQQKSAKAVDMIRAGEKETVLPVIDEIEKEYQKVEDAIQKMD